MLRDKANRAMQNKEYRTALDIYEKLAEDDQPDAMLMCGLIYEKGWDKELLDLDKAGEYFTKLAIKWNAAPGYLGCVRVMLAKHDVQNRDKAVMYCRDLIKGKYRRDGYLNLGHVYEELFDPPELVLARRSYFHAFASGSSWALRQYAISLMKSRNYIRGIAMHVIATVVAPFLVLRGGSSATRDG